MASKYVSFYNEFIDNAAFIQAYLSGTFMSQYQGSVMDYGDNIRYLDRMMPVKVDSYRRTGTEDEDRALAQRAVSRGVAAFHANGCGIGYFLVSDGR